MLLGHRVDLQSRHMYTEQRIKGALAESAPSALERRMTMKIIITANYKGKRVKRVAYSDFQAWVAINVLSREGATDIKMMEEED